MTQTLNEKTVEFDNSYIHSLGNCNPHLAHQLSLAIANELRSNNNLKSISFIHRNTLPVQQFYDETFDILNVSKKQLNDLLQASDVNSITFTYNTDKGEWLIHQIWSR